MLTLVLGGARSGKSRYAQTLCAGRAVVYVATATTGDDAEMVDRVARHRADRPAAWVTVEEPLDVPGAVAAATEGSVVLVDCVTVWISNLMWHHRDLPPREIERLVLGAASDLAVVARGRDVVAVSNDVGSGLVPETAVGRAFRDIQGLANQVLAAEAGAVYLTVAGLPLSIKTASVM